MMKGNNSKIGGGGFHHVSIKVKDFDKSVKFYTDGLGFTESMSWGEGDKRGILLDTGDGNFLEIFAGAGSEERPLGTYEHMALRTDNCDLAIRQAEAAGGQVTIAPTDAELKSTPVTPIRIAFCKGPDGELIEFFQYR